MAEIPGEVVSADGAWTFYFHTISGGEIGRATAASPTDPWVVDPEPVLTGGASGEWDARALAWPNVVQTEGELRMYYGAQGPDGTAIGLATSRDGIEWTKHDNPETSSAPYAESDPVLLPAEEWESIKVDRPRVVHSPDGWVMI